MDEGRVYLVGAGPGDPELLTLKGLRCLQQAHLVLHDSLANRVLLGHVNPGCEIVDVGKKPGSQKGQQADINRLMIKGAREGRTVVRLKGGDPFLFGRGGEEADSLREAGIAYEVVPGVTSPISVPAYAGIPVTHREISPHLTIVTGHRASLEGTPEVDWDALARLDGTLVILMGVRNRAKIATRLINGGRSPDTPVAVIQDGTLPSQKTIRTRLENLSQVTAESPAIIVVGKVADLDMDWFEARPLFGKRILVTRSLEQSGEFARALQNFGAEVLEAPTIEFAEPKDWSRVDSAINEAESFHWIVFASVNAVDRFFGRVLECGRDLRIFHRAKFAVVGSATAARVKDYSIRVTLCPAEYTAEALGRALALEDVEGQRILVPRPEVAREHLAEVLGRLGADVEQAVVYRTIAPDRLPEDALQALTNDAIDLISFTSSSTARNLISLVGGGDLLPKLLNVPAACIGPSTSKTAIELGFRVVASPTKDEVTVEGLTAAIRNYFRSQASL
jgi:uroporphyrinogen III methyltransferase/synthase